MSSETSEDQELEDRLIAASSHASGFRSRVETLREEADGLPMEHKRRLQKFTGQWTQDNVQGHINELERIIREPQVAQSEDRLEAIDIPKDKIDTIRRDTLEKFSEIDDLVDVYENLHDKFGEYVEFLVAEDYLIHWLQEDGPVEAKHQIEIANETKFQNITNLENTPKSLKKQFFGQVFLDERSIEEVENLEQWVDLLLQYGVKITFERDLSTLMDDCETAFTRVTTLKDEYGYNDESIQSWIDDMSVTEAKEELQRKIDEAGQKREQLQLELVEYCQLLGKDAADYDKVPELENEVDSLYEEILDKIGATGEELLDYLRGRREDLPETDDPEELVEALEQVRPLLQRRFEEE